MREKHRIWTYQESFSLRTNITQVEVSQSQPYQEDGIDWAAGGEGNRVKPSDDELAAARQNNEQVRSASFTKDRSGLKGFADKAKDVLRPNN